MFEPSLTNAYAQRDRGRDHLAALRVVHDRICAEQAFVTTYTTEPGRVISFGEAERVLTDPSGRALISPECALLIGECANSFRKALDYLVHQLSALDSGVAQPMTQFPIAHQPAQFVPDRKLAGLSPAHVDRIEALQPYRGSLWTGPLALLSNRDKHNDLVLVEHDYQASVRVAPHATTPGPELLLVTVTVIPTLALSVPGTSMNVLATLSRIEAGVTETLDAFASDFRR